MKKAIAVYLAFTLISGCAVETCEPSRMVKTKPQIEAYLQSCERGHPVSDIEARLNLPDPSETEAPASDWPHWKFKYFVNDMVVAFLADKASDGQDGFVYIGEPQVWRVSEYWRERHDKVERWSGGN